MWNLIRSQYRIFIGTANINLQANWRRFAFRAPLSSRSSFYVEKKFYHINLCIMDIVKLKIKMKTNKCAPIEFHELYLPFDSMRRSFVLKLCICFHDKPLKYYLSLCFNICNKILLTRGLASSLVSANHQLMPN